MAQIAHVREFDDTGTELEFTPGGTHAEPDAFTIAVIFKVASITSTGFETFTTLAEGGGAGLWFGRSDNALQVWTNAGLRASGAGISINEWQLAIATKPAGTAATSIHVYDFADDQWVHNLATGSAQVALSSTFAAIKMGRNQTDTEPLDGFLAAVGWWFGTVLSQAERETLPDGIAAWDALNPDHLYLLNQTAVTEQVLDRTGGWDETARVDTTVAAASDLAFDVGGDATAPREIFIRHGRMTSW